jgi:ABC-type multidrug transport system permease subunit
LIGAEVNTRDGSNSQVVFVNVSIEPLSFTTVQNELVSNGKENDGMLSGVVSLIIFIMFFFLIYCKIENWIEGCNTKN